MVLGIVVDDEGMDLAEAGLTRRCDGGCDGDSSQCGASDGVGTGVIEGRPENLSDAVGPLRTETQLAAVEVVMSAPVSAQRGVSVHKGYLFLCEGQELVGQMRAWLLGD